MTSTFDAAGPASAVSTIMLVHGSVVTRKIWLPQLRGLADPYRVLAPDLPGHGSLAHLPFTFASAVETLATLIVHEARGRALIVGLSLGGYIAIEVAHRRPETVAGLVLAGCSLNFDGARGVYLRMVSALMRRGWVKMSRARLETKTKRLFPVALADVADATIGAGLYPQPLGPAFAEMAARDFAGLLATFPGPVLIVNGERDTAMRRGEAKFAAAARQGKVSVLANAGHACSLDQPDAFNRVVREFAESLWQSAG